MMFSYGTMLASIRKSLFRTEGKDGSTGRSESTADHLVDIISDIRTDELEEELQSESQKYREAIAEVTQHENAILVKIYFLLLWSNKRDNSIYPIFMRLLRIGVIQDGNKRI